MTHEHTLPCMCEDDACPRPQPCRYKRDLDGGLRTIEWVAARCEELQARREGFKEVEDPRDG